MQCVVDHYGNTQRFAQGDLGAACMNMCHQAFSMGLATCVIGMNDQKKMEKYFGIPEGNEVRLVLAIGHSAEKSSFAKVRKELKEVCSFNFWE